MHDERRWGRVQAAPNEYVIQIRSGLIVAHGAGLSVFAWPGDSWVVVPTSIQRVTFTADQVTAEKVGVEVRGVAVYRVADPLLAFRMLDFGNGGMQRLTQILEDMFVGAARRLVANMSVEACMTRRKEAIATELVREIRPVVSGTGRPDDTTDGGWGLVVDTIEIQDVRVLSEQVFKDLQAPYRASIEQEAREARVSSDHEVHQREVVAAQARLESQRHTATLEHDLAAQVAQQAAALERQRITDELERVADTLDLERRRGEQEAELARLAREVENLISPERIQYEYVREVLPALAAALASNLGTVNLTQVHSTDDMVGSLAALLGQLRALAR